VEIQLPGTTLPGVGKRRAYIVRETGCTITASDGARKRETKELERGRFGPVVSHGQ